MFVRDEYGSYAVTDQRFRPTHYSNTSTGDAPNDPARDPPETRRECQCVVKVTPRALTKSPKKCMMRYDRSSVTLAMKSEVHGASVAQVPASVTWSRQSPTSTAQTRRPHAAPSKSIKAAHLPPMPPKKAAAGSASTVPSGQPQHRQHSSNTCQLPRGARQKLCICMLARG